MIEHVYDTEQFVTEIARVLAPGGFFFITTPFHGYVKNFILALIGFDKHFDVTGPHIRFFSDRALHNLYVSAVLRPHFAILVALRLLWMDTIAFGVKL